MAAPKSPRRGSLQYWPRKRVNKLLPSVNWGAINSGKNLKGFICYKVGMMSAYVSDNTPDSMTKGKKITIPVTVLECPSMKIFSVRFYKDGKVMKEILAENLEKELKRKIKLPGRNKISTSSAEDVERKNKSGESHGDHSVERKLEDVKDFEDVRVIVYSQVKKTNIKKTPDLTELGLAGSVDEKMNFIKENLNKEISVSDVFEKGQLVDLRGLTKGKGFCGPVKRFGITLKAHKSEKGRRRAGSLGPWHPARVTFRAPMAGQLGMFTRVTYNNKIIDMGKSNERLKNIKHFGDVKTDYILVRGSVQGPAKRQLLITSSLRETRKQLKKNFELVEIRK